MDKKEKKHYEPPQVTTVTIKVEQGFQASLTKSALFSVWSGIISEDAGTPGVQDYTVQKDNGNNWEW